MRRVSAPGGGAARFRPPVLGAGLGSVGGAMSVCAQPRCGTHTPPRASWWVLNHQIYASTRSSEICVPGGDERLELPHNNFSCCGVRQGDHSEEPARVDVLGVFPEGCNQLARECGGVDAVERPQFRVVKGTRAPPLRWPVGWGGHGLPVLVRCRASRRGLPWGGASVSSRHVPRGGLPLLGHRAGRGGGQWVIGLLRVGGLCHFGVRPWATRVVLLLLQCGLRALAVWLCCSWGGEPRGARARLVVVDARVQDRCHRAPLAGGMWGGLFPHPLSRPLVGRGLPWPCVRGVLSSWQRVGCRPWERGGG